MRAKRHDDPDTDARMRAPRIYRRDEAWYFDSREGPQFGPFADRHEAENALAVFFAQHAHEQATAAGPEPNRPGAQDGIDHMVREVLDTLRCYREYGERAALNWTASRLECLEQSGDDDFVTVECMRILRYIGEHSDQVFDFAVFLSRRA